jgi:hypothetical protein
MANIDKLVLITGATRRQGAAVFQLLHRDDSLGGESKQWQSR